MLVKTLFLRFKGPERLLVRSISSAARFTVVRHGDEHTSSQRIYFKSDQTDQYFSPFHDIPLQSSSQEPLFNFVCEIPRFTHAKMEINKAEPFNPLSQDIKKGQLRYVHNVFPYYGYIWNYGALPQTYEDPAVHDPFIKNCLGDNDPLDFCEIGQRQHEVGHVYQVKVLGALGMIDDGEADWKVIGIDVTDPHAGKLNDINDVKEHMPGLLEATREWFKNYKVPAGKPVNEFAADGNFFDKQFALNLIKHAHGAWSNLIHGNNQSDKAKSISLVNSCLIGNKHLVTSKTQAEQIVKKHLKEVDNKFGKTYPVDFASIQKVYYLSSK